MFTNVFSNFNTIIEALDASKAKAAPFGKKKYRAMLQSVELLLSENEAPSRSIDTELALSMHALLMQDRWVPTDRDFFGFVSDASDTIFHAASDRQALADLVHQLAYLPLDAEGNGTPARRYTEVMLSVLESPDRSLYMYAAALAVLVYLIVRTASTQHPAQTWLRHHWRALKSSHNATLAMSLLKHSPADYHAARRGSPAERAHFLMKWTAETIACVYSRVYVPAVLDSYGSPAFRRAYADFFVRDCHENKN